MKTSSLFTFFALCASLVFALPTGVPGLVETGYNIKLRVRSAHAVDEVVPDPAKPAAFKPSIETPRTRPVPELLSTFPEPDKATPSKRQLGILASSGEVIDQATSPLASEDGKKFIDLNMPQPN
ncbi:hypothetical protein CKM354_000516400 [Cercospora kikuchii]|uniref:Uncharacterized protein n=1 Tax=Cercospora kikuchii TaxID=84275 RepID=A0A9P3CLE8_9PEZI|nr:uncharacterized protein CKM354_000516400 [Cercospora kikuchii]GIZ41875.1 hypothetical protein CKM354_000516400 [Cercospora kikuchii]